jgi:two-component system sensor histidine kinase UhpB
MEQVQAGDMTSKAPLTGFDPDADSLAQTFNTMLAAIDELSKTRAIQILHAQEQERKRIARELHDETSQVLTSLLISLAMLEESLTSDKGRARIADTRALAHQTLRAVRNLSIDLRPSALDDLGLLPALRWYIKEYQQKCGVEVEFTSSGLKERLSPEMETAIYRIIQESLTNTAKHAHANKVWVSLTEDCDAIHARIRDDGCGFDAPAVLRTPWQDRGLGLGGMMERASLLNGSVDIQSEHGSGTTITVRIPLTRAPEPTEPALTIHPESQVIG